MRELLPIALNLDGQAILLVGGGGIALEKIAKLEETGAEVTLVAPRLAPSMASYIEDRKWIIFYQRPVVEEDLAGKFLVIAATDQDEINRGVVRWAKARGILYNSVDKPEDCQFFMMSTLRRGPLNLSIATTGGFPGLSRALREAFEALLPEESGTVLQTLVDLRRRFQTLEPSAELRMARLRVLAHDFAQELLYARH